MRTSREPVGDEEAATTDAFASFLAGLFPQLVASLSVYSTSQAAAEDIAQDALAAAWLRRSQVEVVRDPRTWVYKVAINRSRSLYRRRLVELRHRRWLGATRGPVGDDVEDRLRLRAAVDALPRRQREVIALRYFSDVSVEDAAKIMGCSPGTVKALTSQALVSLRAQLREGDDGC